MAFSHSCSRRDFLQVGAALPLALLGVHLPAQAEPKALRQTRGQVFINGQPTTAGAALQAGDTIRTAAASEATIVLAGDAHQLRADTQLEIRRDGGQGVLRLLSGGLLSVFQKNDKQLVTPGATIGIRGTAVYLYVGADSTYFCTCFGETELQGRGVAAEMIKSQHHTARVISHQRTATVSGGVMKDHTDEEIKALAALIGRPLPESFLNP